jgi:hypothetical protein
VLFALAAGIAVGLCGNASAMRCGTDIVKQGDARHEVLLKCGSPTFVEQDRWIYNLGSHTFIKVLYFGGDQLQFIDNGQYGSSERQSSVPSSVR